MKNILITCDTEIGELGRGLPEAFELFVLGKTGGESVGVPLINKIASEYGATVEHFVDPYPFLGREHHCLARLCDLIQHAGHRVQLHTHPAAVPENQQTFLHQYPLERQRQIIQQGLDALHRCDTRPIAHRAGGYGANTDTLEALRTSDLNIDASYFHGDPRCQLPFDGINSVKNVAGILEVPITVYRRCSQVLTRKLSVHVKLDFRYGATGQEISRVVEHSPNGAILTLFLHSFNFLKLPFDPKRKRWGRIRKAPELIAEYHALLQSLAASADVRFVTFNDLAAHTPSPEFLCGIERRSGLAQAMARYLRDHLSPYIHV